MQGTRRKLAAGIAALAAIAATSTTVGAETATRTGDGYEARIRRTEGGVPHISGESMADVAFGQGWASGEDRTCDLADQVVRIRGERAQLLGPGEDDANIDSDVTWRHIGIFERASADFEEASPTAVDLLTAFTDGWNAHLDEVGVEGLAGWCAGQPWVAPLEPVEVYAYARSIALAASSGAVTNFIATAQPPAPAPPAPDPAAPAAVAPLRPVAERAGSNGWAIGADRSADGGGLLVANPHFPWEGERRFWEVHLTVPGELDIYGAQLSGLPGVGIGFTDEFAWTHTVSAGNRFTAYRLALVPGAPTTYVYGDEQREMTPTDITVEVLRPDGTLEPVTRTMWSSHYGPMLDLPGVGWTAESAISFRDANLGNDEFIDQYFGMLTADDFDEFMGVHERVQGVPLFNTIAVSKDGRAWYADTSATPNLSDEAIAAYEESVETDGLVAIAQQLGAVLLDGSDPMFEWVKEKGARDPGLVPYRDMPQIERDDYVFNANDSFWVAHAEKLLEGDYSPLHGRQETARTPRTRENAVVLGDRSDDGPAGDDGDFTLRELADAALQNRGYTSRVLLDDVVARCDPATTVDVPELAADEDVPGLPAASVDVTAACDVLAAWDGVYDLDRAGPPIWREMLAQLEAIQLREDGPLWAEPFDPKQPIDTPSGLAAAPADAPDPVLERLARAVQVLAAAGVPVDATLGDVQFALRNGTRVPIHGGNGFDGTTNIVGFTSASILDPALDEIERQFVAPNSPLAQVAGHTGYLINSGTSFLMAMEFTDDGPRARVFLTYSNTEDRTDPNYLEATQRFSAKDWRTVAWTDAQIDDQETTKKTVRG
ncbi:MAG TPA: penicillin acylase family protein [Acidimicrobiia bacterium]|nr:penicillin acylase family protein [Acidimicrobiia bacterium]